MYVCIHTCAHLSLSLSPSCTFVYVYKQLYVRYLCTFAFDLHLQMASLITSQVPSQRAMQKLNLAHDGIARQLQQQAPGDDGNDRKESKSKSATARKCL